MINYTIDDVLDGEPNVDHKGVVRWRFITRCEPDSKTFTAIYFSLKELSDYFQGYIDEMSDCITGMKECG